MLRNLFNRQTLGSGALALLITGALIFAFAPPDAQALTNVTTTQATFKCDDPFDMTVFIAGDFSDSDSGGDEFELKIVDGDDHLIYSGTQTVSTGSQSARIYLPLSDLNREPSANPIELRVSDNGELLNAPKIDAPCFDASGEVDDPVDQEEARGVHRVYANFQDTIIYYPSQDGDLGVWYLSPDGVGLFVGRFPKAQLDSSQEPGNIPLATWNWGDYLTWNLYYIGEGMYQVNHTIGGVLNDEFVFKP